MSSMQGEMSGGSHVQASVEQVILGIDPGEKRIGVAVKRAATIAAEPLQVLERSDDIWSELTTIAEREGADVLIVGLPRDINGHDTAQTVKARAFAGELAERSNYHVIMYDEFDSSGRARQRLSAKTRVEEKRWLDSYAAAILIEDYLESLV